MITIPDSFRTNIVRLGRANGQQWLAELRSIVERLCQRWQLVPDGAVMHGGLSLVVTVQRRGTMERLNISRRAHVAV